MSYKGQIETLLSAAAGLEERSAETERGLQYHIDSLKRDRREIELLGEQATALRKAAETLGLMDKAGVTMKVPA